MKKRNKEKKRRKKYFISKQSIITDRSVVGLGELSFLLRHLAKLRQSSELLWFAIAL